MTTTNFHDSIVFFYSQKMLDTFQELPSLVSESFLQEPGAMEKGLDLIETAQVMAEVNLNLVDQLEHLEGHIEGSTFEVGHLEGQGNMKAGQNIELGQIQGRHQIEGQMLEDTLDDQARDSMLGSAYYSEESSLSSSSVPGLPAPHDNQLRIQQQKSALTLPLFDNAMDVTLPMYPKHGESAVNTLSHYGDMQPHSDLTTDDAVLSLAQRMCKIYETRSPDSEIPPQEHYPCQDGPDFYQQQTPILSDNLVSPQSSNNQFVVPSLPNESNNRTWNPTVLDYQCSHNQFSQNIGNQRGQEEVETLIPPPEQLNQRRRFTIPKLQIIRTKSDAADPSELNMDSSPIHGMNSGMRSPGMMSPQMRSPAISPDRLSAGSPRMWAGSPESAASSYCSSNPSPEDSMTPSPRSSLASPMWPFR